MLPNLGRLALQQADTRDVFKYGSSNKKHWDEEYPQIHQDPKESPTCPVCFLEFENSSVIVLDCGHVFHEACIREWREKNKQDICPTCRQSYDYEKSFQQTVTPEENKFLKAAQEDDLERVSFWLEKGVDVNVQDAFGHTALTLACFNGSEDLCITLLNHGEINVNLANFGNTALLYASAQFGDPTVVRMLIAKGADVNAQGDDGMTPLMTACKHGHATVALELLEREEIDVNLKDEYGQSALDHARHKRLQAVVKRIQNIVRQKRQRNR